MASVSDYLVEYLGSFTIVKCNDCGLAYLRTQPSFDDLLRVFYPSDYISYDDGSLLNRLREKLKHKSRYKDLSRYVPTNGKVLDIGPGSGLLAKVLADISEWELHVVEPNTEICQRFSAWGVAAHPSTLEDAELSTNHFDAITMMHVIEHVPDPITTIDEIHRVLKPGGILLTEQPNFNSAARHLFGSAWWGYHAPRHLTHFTPQQLCEILTNAGFDILKVRHPVRPACNPWSLSIALKNSRYLKHFSSLVGNRSPVAIAIMLPAELVLALLERNDVFEVLAIKR